MANQTYEEIAKQLTEYDRREKDTKTKIANLVRTAKRVVKMEEKTKTLREQIHAEMKELNEYPKYSAGAWQDAYRKIKKTGVWEG